MNRIEMIIDRLIKHEISKSDATELVKELLNERRDKGALELEVLEVSCNINDDGFIKAKIPREYKKLDEKGIEKGSKIDISVVY
jgi:hypothetical protein